MTPLKIHLVVIVFLACHSAKLVLNIYEAVQVCCSVKQINGIKVWAPCKLHAVIKLFFLLKAKPKFFRSFFGKTEARQGLVSVHAVVYKGIYCQNQNSTNTKFNWVLGWIIFLHVGPPTHHPHKLSLLLLLLTAQLAVQGPVCTTVQSQTIEATLYYNRLSLIKAR